MALYTTHKGQWKHQGTSGEKASDEWKLSISVSLTAWWVVGYRAFAGWALPKIEDFQSTRELRMIFDAGKNI